jgi:hypothetical protein
MSSVKKTWPAKKAKKGETIKEIVFDDDARRYAGVAHSLSDILSDSLYALYIREYLTGFRKRNLAKKEARAARAKQKQKQEQLELRREVRFLSQCLRAYPWKLLLWLIGLDFYWQKRKDLAQRAAENYAAVERAFKGSNLSGAVPNSHI